jgi:hypothetical protein
MGGWRAIPERHANGGSDQQGGGLAGGLAAVGMGIRRSPTGSGALSPVSAARPYRTHLRRVCAETHALCRAIGARYEVDLTCGLIGLRDGEMRGIVFAEAANFEPRDASAWLSPDIGGTFPTTAQEVLSVAQRQLRFVRPAITPPRRVRRSPSPRSVRTGSPRSRFRC